MPKCSLLGKSLTQTQSLSASMHSANNFGRLSSFYCSYIPSGEKEFLSGIYLVRVYPFLLFFDSPLLALLHAAQNFRFFSMNVLLEVLIDRLLEFRFQKCFYSFSDFLLEVQMLMNLDGNYRAMQLEISSVISFNCAVISNFGVLFSYE